MRGLFHVHSLKTESGALDQFDLVAVRVLDKGDNGRAMLHRSRRARDADAFFFHLRTRTIDIRHCDSEVTKAGPMGVGLFVIPVRCQLKHRMFAFIAITHKSK